MRFTLLVFCLAFSIPISQAARPVPLDTDRIHQIAAMLPAEPGLVGDHISNRTRWNELRDHLAFGKVIPEAEKLLATDFPEKPESLVLDFKNTGNRTNWQRVDSLWRKRLRTLFLAECLENKGRFLSALEEIIVAFCDERTWVMPAHDKGQNAYDGRIAYADLKATDVGMSLGIIHQVLGQKLTPELRKRMKNEVLRRNLEPFKERITGDEKLGWWWITGRNNWNAVCLAGITGAALAFVEDRYERALFVTAAETYSKCFLSGFTRDGYCSEGMGYWCYGYGHYVLMSEFIYSVTGGRIDLLQCEGARAAGRYGGVLEIQNGIQPAFADCSVDSKPTKALMHYLSRRFGFGFSKWDDIDPAGVSRNLATTMVFSFPNSAARCQPKQAKGPRLEKRTWFSDAGVLICRPGSESSARLAVAMKGGHNAEFHNHNDIGSYMVVSGSEDLLVDPGGEVYTGRTFSSKRYDSNVLNSLGHPVPKVAGKLQSQGSKARGEVVSTSFEDESDELVIDLKSAYAVPDLITLQRSFHYSRIGIGAFRVSDTVVFDSPQSFETALITLSRWVQKDENTLIFRDFDEGIEVGIEVTGGAFEVVPMEIDENVQTKTKPTRIAIRMKEPVKEATISLTIAPDRSSQSPELFNGGFELGTLGWRMNDGGMTRMERTIVSSGTSALQIKDGSQTKGSNLLSARMRVEAGTRMLITGKHYPVSGKGVGLYLYCYDQDRNRLNEKNKHGNVSPLMVLKAGPKKKWNSFSKEFAPLPNTETIRLWIHSMSSAVVDAVLDEIVIEER